MKVAAPRFVIDVGDGSVALEPEAEPILGDGLAGRGHTVARLRDPGLAGHAHVIALGPDGYEVASDPRCDGAAAGI